MVTLSTYSQKWKLKLSITKTVTTAFHLYNKAARRELTGFPHNFQNQIPLLLMNFHDLCKLTNYAAAGQHGIKLELLQNY